MKRTHTKIYLVMLLTAMGCGGGSNNTSGSFSINVVAPDSAYDYSPIEITVSSSSQISSIRLVSDDLTLLNSNNNSLSVLLPIVTKDTTYEYKIIGMNSSGEEALVTKNIEVKIFYHPLENFTLLSQGNYQNFSTKDYSVFNFSFEAINTEETFTEILCYPTANDCSESGGIFSSDMHNSNYGDFNGDGYEDLVVSWAVFPHTLERNTTKSYVGVYLNDGMGRLKRDDQFFFDREPPSRHMTYRIVVNDFNQDGVDDIFVGTMGLIKTNPNGEQSFISEPNILLLSENGFIRDYTNLISSKDQNSFSHDASSGDVNGDGYPDILAGRNLFLNDMGKNFINASEDLPDTWKDWPKYKYVMSSLMNDFNNDGYADIVMFWNDDEFNPNPPSPEIALSDPLTEIKEWKINTLPDGFFGKGLTKFNYAQAADIDADGDLDIVVGTTRAKPYYVGRYIQILINDGEGNFTDESYARLSNQERSVNYEDPDAIYECKTHGEGPLFIRDFDGDGSLDIIDQTASYSQDDCPGVTIFLNRGNGKFERDTLTQLAWVSGNQIEGFYYDNQINPINRAIPMNLDGRNKLDFASIVYAASNKNVRFLYEIISK